LKPLDAMKLPIASVLFALTLSGLAGCDLLGIESPQAVVERRTADGSAIGGACRHAGRAIEDCYTLNRRADKAAMFAGWREMDDYMRENNIVAVPPQIEARGAAGESADDDGDTGKTASKPGSHDS
jgi:hypothetical protein